MRVAPGRGPRFRLVAVVVLIALVPTTAAAWAFLRSARANALENADLRLAAALAPATAELEAEADRSAAVARGLAGRRGVQQALAERDVATLRRLARRMPGLSFTAGRIDVAGVARTEVVLEHTVAVVRDGRTVGYVRAGVPIDDDLERQLTRASGLADGRVLAVPVAGPIARGPAGEGEDVEVAGVSYRAVSSPRIGEELRLVAMVPKSVLDDQQDSRRGRVLLAALATLATVAFAAYAVPPALARDRLARRGLDLIGDALAATHNADALLPVILDAAVDATGAAGGVLLERGIEVARIGRRDVDGDPLRLVLPTAEEEPIELVLYPRATGFGADAREIGEWLAGQAAIALENARLHRVARQQAVEDPLTHLANRRRFMEALTAELNRAKRFESPLALVLADLDNFKRINDRFGHHVGDEVLRETARALTENLREVDLPARIGGEEFAVLLPETDLAGAERLAERLRRAVAALRVAVAGGDRVEVTASFGVAAYRESSNEAELLRAADAALYRAKLAGKNRVASEAADPV